MLNRFTVLFSKQVKRFSIGNLGLFLKIKHLKIDVRAGSQEAPRDELACCFWIFSQERIVIKTTICQKTPFNMFCSFSFLTARFSRSTGRNPADTVQAVPTKQSQSGQWAIFHHRQNFHLKRTSIHPFSSAHPVQGHGVGGAYPSCTSWTRCQSNAGVPQTA